jgi:subtilase family serine protease
MPFVTTSRRARRSVTAAISVAGLLTTVVSLAPTAAAAFATTAAASTATVAVGRPSWATAAASTGAVAGGTPITARLYLDSQNPAGLAAYAKAVADPDSSRYGRYLSAKQTAAQFGPSATNTSVVVNYLIAQGVTVFDNTAHYLDISGSAAQIESAFGTTLDDYSTSTGTHYAPVSDNLSLPASVAPGILTVTGLDGLTDTSARPDSESVAESVTGSEPETGPESVSASGSASAETGQNTPASSVPEQCSTYWDQYTATGFPTGYTTSTPTAPCPYYPAQIRKAYGVTQTGLTGKGATVAIVDAYGSPTMLADANEYATGHGDAAFRAGQYTEVINSADWELQDECGGASGWAPEESLDVEMAHGLAPNADVVYVGANSCSDGDFLAAEQEIVDDHLADVVSDSWGEIMHGPAGYFDTSIIPAYEQTFEQGAVERIGFNFSSGDCADQAPAAAATGVNCDPNSIEAQTNWPTSDPWVTSVGATALAISNPKGAYQFETSMGDDRSVLSSDGTSWDPLPGFFYFGGGGGTSPDFGQPWYQAWAVPYALSHTLSTGAHSATAQRTVPDVAMNGDLVTSTLVGLTQDGQYSEAGYGGTSVASPEFAGVLADAIQARRDNPLGFVNPALYLRSHLFTDVVQSPAADHLGGQTISAVLDLGVGADGAREVRDYALGQDYGLTATRGYDDATGLGSPNAQLLYSFE